jgi:hypothetical protein
LQPVLILCYQQFMARSITVSKKSRGRPKTTGIGTLIGMRWHADDLNRIDAWREAHPEKPDRTEAIRRLVRAGLAAVTTEVKVLPAKPKADVARKRRR